jgi:hypothetical protein
VADGALDSEPGPVNRRDWEALKEGYHVKGTRCFRFPRFRKSTLLLESTDSDRDPLSAGSKASGFYMHYGGANYTGAAGIHDTLITGLAQNTIIEYDAYRNIRGGKKLQVIRNLCLAHHAQTMRYKCGKIDENRLFVWR